MDPQNINPHAPNRKALLDDSQPTDVSNDPARKSIVTGTPHYTRSTMKRSESNSKLISGIVVLMLVQLGLVAVGGWVFFKKEIQPKLGSGASAAPSIDPQPDLALQQALATLSGATAQIDQLQSQLDGARAEQARTQQQLQETNERVVALMRDSATSPVRTGTSVNDPGTGRMASVEPNLTPAGEELVLIKERNRLTAYADKAIATGEREPLQALVETMLDPDMARLHYGAQSEFNRVRYHLEYDARIDPNYTLPVRELFKNPDIRSEADLKAEQLTKILQDHQQPWEARLRAAWLLKGSEDPATDAVLLKAIQEDPSLDVVKQAQTTFERRIGRRFRLFDIPSIESWWSTQHPEEAEAKAAEEAQATAKTEAESKPAPKPADSTDKAPEAAAADATEKPEPKPDAKADTPPQEAAPKPADKKSDAPPEPKAKAQAKGAD